VATSVHGSGAPVAEFPGSFHPQAVKAVQIAQRYEQLRSRRAVGVREAAKEIEVTHFWSGGWDRRPSWRGRRGTGACSPANGTPEELRTNWARSLGVLSPSFTGSGLSTYGFTERPPKNLWGAYASNVIIRNITRASRNWVSK